MKAINPLDPFDPQAYAASQRALFQAARAREAAHNARELRRSTIGGLLLILAIVIAVALSVLLDLHEPPV